MRKYLLGSSALAASALAVSASAADKIELELQGYAQFGAAGIVSEPEGGGGNSVVFGSDSEVHFRGKTTFDNGLTVSFRAELELDDDPEVDDDSDTIDEVYAQFDGNFGRIQIGMQDGVADQMIVSAPNVFSQFTISSIDMNPFELYTSSDIDSPARDLLGVSSVLDTSPDFSADHTKIIYFTPRFYGIQIASSYAPNPCRNDTGLDLNVRDGAAADPLGASCGNKESFGQNYWEVAGNFEHELNGFGLGLSASYGNGDGNPNVVGALSNGPSEWHGGGEVSFGLGGGKLTIGGAYKETDNIDAEHDVNIAPASGVAISESRHWDVGAKFSHGPWEFGAAYGQVEDNNESGVAAVVLGAVKRKLATFIGGVSYKVGPGVKLGLGVMHSDAEIVSELCLVSVCASEVIDDADPTAVFSELDLRF